MTKHRKIAWTLLAVLVTALAASGVADVVSDDYADQALKRALVTFAVARSLNGVISVAQGTEVAVEPGGVGVNLTVGQILDPINDLIEQFSSVMLVAASSLGLQKILLGMAGWWGVTFILALAAVFLIVSTWWPGNFRSKLATLAAKVFFVTAFLRFALPLLIIATHMIFSTFLQGEHDAATAVLEATSSEIEALRDEEPAPENEDASFMESIGDMIDSSMRRLDVAGRLDRLRDSASQASEQIVNLIVIFVLQTVILPLAFLWLFVEGLKRVAGRAISGSGED
jgi:hypothetical protein